MGLVKWRFQGALCFDLDPCDFFDQEELGNNQHGVWILSYFAVMKR